MHISVYSIINFKVKIRHDIKYTNANIQTYYACIFAFVSTKTA